MPSYNVPAYWILESTPSSPLPSHLNTSHNYVKEQSIQINNIKYTYLIQKETQENGIEYRFIRQPHKTAGKIPCLLGKIIDNTFELYNITKDRSCTYPVMDKYFAKRSIELLKRILKKEHPNVTTIFITDNSFDRCNKKDFNLCDMSTLKHGRPYYDSIGFMAIDSADRERIDTNELKVKKALFIRKLIPNCPAYVKDGEPLTSAMQKLSDMHCDLLAQHIHKIMKYYDIDSTLHIDYSMNI